MNVLLFLVAAVCYALLFAVASDFVCEFVSHLDHDIVCVCCVLCRTDRVDDAPRTSGWKIVLCVFLAIFVLICLVGAYLLYQSQSVSRKRFY